MRQATQMQSVLGFLVALLSLTACATPKATHTPTTAPTYTPDPCTGWTCAVTGIVYAGTAQPGNELAGATVTIRHTSNCSPTRGERQATTGPDGSFEFGNVFLHDTDRIRIGAESEGHESGEWDSVDRYCLYCSCFGNPLVIVLRAAPGP